MCSTAEMSRVVAVSLLLCDSTFDSACTGGGWVCSIVQVALGQSISGADSG